MHDEASRLGFLLGQFEGPLPMKLPCWRYEGRVVWGLTYKMLDQLLDVTLR